MKPLVIIPSYNTGARLESTIRDVLSNWADGPIWVSVDGSTDGSDEALKRSMGAEPRLKIIRSANNRGKGTATLEAARLAYANGYTHACVFDADGQHCAEDIWKMFALIPPQGNAMALGVPIFGPEAPSERVKGRRVGNTFAKIETLWRGPEDSLYGLRVYPLAALIRLMSPVMRGKRYEFDTEAAVRLTWSGVQPINFSTPVRYLSRDEGGVSHFKYVRDNIRLVIMHIRLLAELPFRIPSLLINSAKWTNITHGSANKKK